VEYLRSGEKEMRFLMENWRKYLKEAEIDWDEFGFSDEERGEAKPSTPAYEDLVALDRGDTFTIGNRKPVYRVIGAPTESGIVGSQTKTVVIDGSAERKSYIVRGVTEDFEVAAFEVIGSGPKTKDNPRGKPGVVSNIVKGEQLEEGDWQKDVVTPNYNKQLKNVLRHGGNKTKAKPFGKKSRIDYRGSAPPTAPGQ